LHRVTPPAYTVAVRELCEFAAKQGDLDLRFTPSPTAEEGMQGHKTVASRRGSDHRSEVTVTGVFDDLRVRGRVDGYSESRQLLEEVKTFKGDLELMPANHRALHWAQAKVYAWLLCQQLNLAELRVSLVYFDIATETETPLVQRCSATELRAFFESLCTRFLAWARQELAHRAERDLGLVALAFPHDSFRGGQRALAENAYKAVQLGRGLLAQAPTGIGKTLGTLFPLLKAAPAQKLDKIFFLSAKTAGRAVALDALAVVQRSQPVPTLRVVELVARDKVCEHPDKACHGDSCPLAQGFYDRLPAARDAAVRQPLLTREPLRELARVHGVCPYYLSQELVRWADVVVGDYNYYFDSGGALLYGLTVVNEWNVAVLVDEAHNLVERARGMYSAELAPRDLRAALQAAPAELKPALHRVSRTWQALATAQDAPYQAYAKPPENLVSCLRDLATAISNFSVDSAVALDEPLLRFYFDALHFGRLAESFGTHSLFDLSVEHGAHEPLATLCIRNVVPAPFLKPRFAAARTTVLFSATLSPHRFYADSLGLPEDTAWLDVEGTFGAEQLDVHIVANVSTRFRRRGHSLAPIARLMAAQYARAPGNYLAFFSSFDYLQQALDAFSAEYPEVPVWQQARQMSEAQRQAFLARFVPDGAGIAFAVLGGAFAEGIDLPGTRLIGAFIATLGMPQFNPVNEQMRRTIDATFGAGYEYTYLYPGIRKVVQAAGRVIRTPSDRGSLFLIDDRFARDEVWELLPRWWNVQRRSPAAAGVS
jgi:Rad3-related DNA helicase